MVVDIGMPQELPVGRAAEGAMHGKCDLAKSNLVTRVHCLQPGIEMPSTWGKNLKLRIHPGSFLLFEPLPDGPGGVQRTRVCASVHADIGIR